MVRAGVPETVAMSLTGHRTRAMFDRYNITSQEDQRDALKQLAAYVSALPAHDEKVAEHSPREEAASYRYGQFTDSRGIKKKKGGPKTTLFLGKYSCGAG